jgi:hypothetical protein
MEPVARPVLVRTELVDTPATEVPDPRAASGLTVTAVYHLSEAGRKASLLDGGDGHAVQRITIEVPANRLHLVSVNGHGIARLKLRPRYELDAEQQVVCIDMAPVYDHPPTIDELMRQAARNHQLERAYHAKRTITRDERSDTDRVRRTEIALAFLADSSQRALVHPSPTPRRCYLATRYGHLRFDRVVDVGPARDVPKEALRRFRADVKGNRERRARERAEHVRLRDERWTTMIAWIDEHGTPDQKARLAARLLPPSEIKEAMADEAFRALTDRPRYTHDGVEQMRAHVQQWTGRRRHHVSERDFVVFGHPVRTVTNRQWALLEEIRAAVPDAHMVDGNRDLEDPTDASHGGLFRGFILRNSDVGAAALTLDVFLYRAVCGNNIIWGFRHVAAFRRRHVGASIHAAWTDSLESVRTALDASMAHDRTLLLRATTQELGSTRDAVLDAVTTRVELSRKQAADAYGLAEQFETNPRSVWGYVQGLTRLSQRTSWQDHRFALDRAASRLLTTVH